MEPRMTYKVLFFLFTLTSLKRVLAERMWLVESYLMRLMADCSVLDQCTTHDIVTSIYTIDRGANKAYSENEHNSHCLSTAKATCSAAFWLLYILPSTFPAHIILQETLIILYLICSLATILCSAAAIQWALWQHYTQYNHVLTQ